jgi:hypothetical protein
MPYTSEWAEPEVLLEHKGVTVYHIYKDDDYDQGARRYSYTTDYLGSDDGSCSCAGGGCLCCCVFDIRLLPGWTDPHPPFMGRDGDDSPENQAAWERWHGGEEEAHHRAFIKLAIDWGVVVKGEGQ